MKLDRFLLAFVVAISTSFNCLIQIPVVQAVVLEPPVSPYKQTATISSPWGPRKLNGVVQYHNGIDYPGQPGSPIQSVEAGTITQINVDGAGDWYMMINGSTSTFGYMHMFDDILTNFGSIQSTYLTCSFCWMRTAYLNDSTQTIVDLVALNPLAYSVPYHGIYQSTLPPCYAFVFWGSNGRDSPPSKILTSRNCAGKTIGGVTARADVTDHEVIAPIGHSGISVGSGGGYHLHLGAQGFKMNPLMYVDHPKSHYNATFQSSPMGGSVYLNVDYTTGKDLDSFAFAIQPINPSSNVAQILLFSYKGSLFSPKCSNFVLAAGCTEVALGPRTSDIKSSDGESLGIIPNGSGKATIVVPIANGASYLPMPNYACNHQAPSCGGPPAIQDYPTYIMGISNFNVCGFESPDPTNANYYTPNFPTDHVGWITLSQQLNIFPSVSTGFYLNPNFGLCTFGVAP